MKEKFFGKLETLIAEARRLTTRGFDEQEPEEATKQSLIEPLLQALGFTSEANYTRGFKILGDSVDYLLKSDRPLMFVEAKSLLDSLDKNLFDKHREQVHRYIQNYRLSPEITKMEQPVKWILLTNFAQLHLIRVNEITPSFAFKLDDLWPRREELWELLALENLEADRIDELYDQHKKASLDQLFLADLKRWRLLIANGFALRNQKRSLDEITLASQQLLDRFIFCRMLETQRLVEYNKLARTYSNYEVLYARADKTFGEILRESLFVEIKNDFNTELFEQPLLCDQLDIDNAVLSAVIGHEPLAPELAAQCGFESGQGELLAFRHLYRYDFSLMSSDVMGAVYERFLAHKLSQSGGRVVIEDTDELRKKEGIYYTPQYIVDYIVAHTLGEKIKPILAEAKTLLGYKNFKGALAKIRELGEIKVLDPAMGSGSFLLRAFDALVKAYDDYNQECRRLKKERNGHGALFDADFVIPEEVLEVPLHVLTENIFGVDLDKQAVEVAKLNLWLRYMAVNRDPFIKRLREKRGGQPLSLLPNLTHNLKRGNSLIADANVAGEAAFDWEKEFPEIMGKVGQASRLSGAGETPALRCGFDVVIGNPPYHMLQPHNTSDEMLAHLRQHFVKVEFKIDLFQLFLQRAVSFLKQGSRLGYIIPTTILNNVYAESLRQWLTDQCCIERIAVCRNQVFADADVHTSVLIFRREPDAALREKHEILTTEDLPEPEENRTVRYFRTRQSRFAELPGHVWNILLNEENAGLITKLANQSVTLKTVATLNRGLITGNRDRYFAATKATAKHVPIIEGGDVDRYFAAPPSNFVLFERPESAGGCWDEEVHFAEHKIVIRQIAEKPIAGLLQKPLAVTGNIFTIRASDMENEFYLLGIINSRLTEFFWKTMFADFKTSFPQVTVFSLEQLPIKKINEKSKKELTQKKNLMANVKAMLVAQNAFHNLPGSSTFVVGSRGWG
jgi:type I restriction-modification system DNA methylase subunit